jgi:DNA topoisomerase IB
MPLYPHQKSVVRHLLSARGVLCIHSTGTGKTLTSIAAAQALLKNKTVRYVVALVKKSILDQYTQAVREVDPALVEKFTISTAETFLLRTKDQPPAAHTFFIVDEAHAFTNAGGVLASAMHAFAVKCARVILLTATPYTNALYDLAPLICMVKGIPIVSRKEFDRDILKDDVASPTFLEWMRGCVSLYVIDKNSAEGYPRLTEHVVSIPASKKTRAKIQALQKEEHPFYSSERQISLGLEGGQCEKCAWLVEHLADWIHRKGEDRVVLYTAFIDAGVYRLLDLLVAQRINAVVIDGDTALGMRKKVLTVFNRAAEGAVKVGGGKTRRRGCGGSTWFVRVTRKYKPGSKEAPTYQYYKKLDMDTLKPSGEIKPTEAQLEATRHPPIPPAWSPAVVCTAENAKVRWEALDSKKRWQRRYSEEWELTKEETKMRIVARLDPPFWRKFHRVIESHLAAKEWSADKLHALAVKTMSLCFFRVGGDTEDEHFGVTTLQRRHCELRGGALHFSFVGKSGVQNESVVARADEPVYVREMAALLKTSGGADANLFEVDGVGIRDASVRAFLKEEGIELRPKDFRTYHANLRMLELLSEAPEAAKPAERKKVVGRAFAAVAAELNNTPAVTKSSYVFNPLWVWFVTSPVDFAAAQRGDPAQRLVDIVQRFLDLELDWKAMLQDYKDNFGLKTFAGEDITTLVITDAGAESLDLKGVRHVVMIDGVWNKALQDQIVGRGQRFRSHAHLPKAKQTIHAWKLILDFDDEKSPERLMHDLVEQKAKESEALYAALKTVSV